MKPGRTIFLIFAFCLTAGAAFSKTATELMNEGKMNLFRGEIKEGIRLLEEADSMEKNSPYIMLLLAKGYSWNNEWDRAKKLYGEIAASTGPGDQVHWEARFGIAQVTSWEKKYDEALSLYGQILESYKKIPDNFRFDVNLAIGDIYSWKMDYSKAVEHFSAMLADKPDNLEVLNRIAKIYLWEGEYAKSGEFTDRVLALDSRDRESAERARVLDQIKTFTVSAGYLYTYYDTENYKGDKIQSHNAMMGFNWQYSIPFRVFTYLTGIRQNSIESRDPEESALWNNDINLRLGGIYRINPLTFLSAAGDYTHNAQIYADFSSEISLSRKLNQNIDILALYKFTFDRIDSTQDVDSKMYHLFSPGIIFYYNPEIYNRVQFYVETDSKDLNYSVLINQYLAVNPENIFRFYVFLSQGRSYLTFSDTSVLQKVTTYSASLAYTHFFNSSFGMEFSTGLTSRIDYYNNYYGGLSVIYKW